MDSAAARAASAGFETMLLQQIFAPMMQGCDTFGSFGAEMFAQSVAQHDASFGAILAREFQEPAQ